MPTNDKSVALGGKRSGSGRKPVKIDLDELEKLCALQCTDQELACFFGVDVRTIERRKKKPAFAAAIERGRAKGKLSVRRMPSASSARHGRNVRQRWPFSCPSAARFRE